jgi:hypothetical protein
MDPDNSCIQYLDFGITNICNSAQDAIPDAGLSPSVEAIVTGRVGAKASRQIPPRRTGTQDPEDAVQHPPIINTRNTSGFIRKDGLNGVPFAVCESIPHD